MRQQKPPNREALLLTILALKVIPLDWAYTLVDDYPFSRRQMYNTIHDLLTNGNFINLNHNKITNEKRIYLTKKGYQRVNSQNIVNYKFKGWNNIQKRVSTIRTTHHAIIFRFLFEYFSTFGIANRLYSDYDKGCKISFVEIGQKLFIKPDTLIYPSSDDSVLMLEADTHEEPQQVIYEKILKYVLASLHNYEVDGRKIKVYFIFKSKKRLNNLFSPQEGTIINFFNELNTFKKTKVISRSIRIKEILQVLSSETLEIYAGIYSDKFSDYQKIDLVNLLILKTPHWKYEL